MGFLGREEQPIRSRLELVRIAMQEEKTVIQSTLATDFPSISPKQRRNDHGAGRKCRGY